MSLEDDVEILRNLPLFCELGHEALRLLAFQASMIELNENEYLFQLGKAAEGAYVVVQGSIAIMSRNESGKPNYIAKMGSLIGRTALITDLDYSASGIAIETSKVMKIPRSAFKKVLQEYPSSAAKIQSVIARDLVALTKELSHIAT